MTQRNDDMVMLSRLLSPANTAHVAAKERTVFLDMQQSLLSGARHTLGKKGRAFCSAVMARLPKVADKTESTPYDVPEVLRHLPKRPPHRRHEVQ